MAELASHEACRLAPFALILAACALMPSVAAADEFHYNDTFMGPRAAGLAGTMIGLADDASTAWYNPAGLGRKFSTTVTVSTTALLARHMTVDTGYDRDLQFKSMEAFSPAGITTTALGNGNIAFMALQPMQDNSQLDQTFSGQGVLDGRITSEESNTSYLVGISYGAKVGRGLSLGIGAGYLYQVQSSHSSIYFDYENAESASGSNDIEFDTSAHVVQHGIMFLAGLLWQPLGEDGPLSLGLTVRTGVNVSSSSSTKTTLWAGFDAPNDDGQYFVRMAADDENSRGVSRTPPMLGIGAAWKVFPFWTLALDLTLHGYVRYESFGTEVTKLATLNGSLATEFYLGDGITLRAGAFTNRSSAELSMDHLMNCWDEYGGTLGATFTRGNYDFTVAVRLSWLNGKVLLSPSDGVEETYSASGRNAGFVFGGNYRF